MKLWQIGLIVFIAGGAINALLINLQVGGILRELARLSILAGIAILIAGLIWRSKKDKN